MRNNDGNLFSTTDVVRANTLNIMRLVHFVTIDSFVGGNWKCDKIR